MRADLALLVDVLRLIWRRRTCRRDHGDRIALDDQLWLYCWRCGWQSPGITIETAAVVRAWALRSHAAAVPAAEGELMRGGTFETLDTIGRRFKKGHTMTDLVTALDPVARTATSAPAVTADELALDSSRTIAKDATPDELQLFLYDNARQGVHPLDKLIHFTKRSGKYTPITSIDFMRIRAADSGECAGIDDPVFAGAPMSAGFTATVTVYRLLQGQRFPFTATARWSEYKPDQDFMWQKMPYLMLGKCAEALALRKAFPKQLSGLYVKEEMEQAAPAPPCATDAGSPVGPPPLPAEGAAPAGPPSLTAPCAPPADLNQAIPEVWKPFVTASMTGAIASGKRAKATGKTTLVMDNGLECFTCALDLGDQAIRHKTRRRARDDHDARYA